LELADECAAFVEDADVCSGGEDGDGLAGVFAAESDVVEPAVVANGDLAVAVDAVVADAVAVDGGGREPRLGFGARLEGVDWGSPCDRAVRPLGVVVVDESVEVGLETADGGRRVLFRQVLLDGLVEALDLAAGLGGGRGGSVCRRCRARRVRVAWRRYRCGRRL
jgi:hypothetical protein